MAMTSREATDARQRLGLSIEEFSAELGLTPNVVEAWEAGTVRVPKRAAKELQWRLALEERETALAASGLPVCAWMESWEEKDFPESTKAQSAHMQSAEDHLKSCSVCKAREQFIADRFGEMPRPPLPGIMPVMVRIVPLVDRMPKWTRPAVWLGLAFGAYSMLRILLLLPAMLREPRVALTALAGLSASVAIGASLGLAYGGFQAARAKMTKQAA